MWGMDGEKVYYICCQSPCDQLYSFRIRIVCVGNPALLSGHQVGTDTDWYAYNLCRGLFCRWILHWEKSKETGVFMGADCRDALLQYSYGRSRCYRREYAGSDRTGDGIGTFVYGKWNVWRDDWLKGQGEVQPVWLMPLLVYKYK